MQVLPLGAPGRDLWSRIADTDPNATFFHSPAWSDLMEAGFPSQACSAAQEFELHDAKRAILPIVEIAKHAGINRAYYSMFPGVYGGPIAERPLLAEERAEIAGWLAGRRDHRIFYLAPPGVSDPVPEGATALQIATHRLKLSADLDLENSPLLSHGKKYSVKRARREGVEVCVSDSVSDWGRYYEAYQESMRRWEQRPAVVYRRRLFEGLAGLSGKGVTLWIATVRDRFAAGAIILQKGGHIVTWHEASFEEFHRTGVNDALHVAVIEHAARRGFEYFDFNPSGGHQGVEQYKASFGAERTPLQGWEWEPAWVRGVKTVKKLFQW